MLPPPEHFLYCIAATSFARCLWSRLSASHNRRIVLIRGRLSVRVSSRRTVRSLIPARSASSSWDKSDSIRHRRSSVATDSTQFVTVFSTMYAGIHGFPSVRTPVGIPCRRRRPPLMRTDGGWWLPTERRPPALPAEYRNRKMTSNIRTQRSPGIIRGSSQKRQELPGWLQPPASK